MRAVTRKTIVQWLGFGALCGVVALSIALDCFPLLVG